MGILVVLRCEEERVRSAQELACVVFQVLTRVKLKGVSAEVNRISLSLFACERKRLVGK